MSSYLGEGELYVHGQKNAMADSVLFSVTVTCVILLLFTSVTEN